MAVAPIVIVAVIVVESTTVTPLKLTLGPAGASVTVVPLAVKLVPVRVTPTAVPRAPELGAIEASVGAAGLTTVKTTLLVDPLAAVVTITFLTPRRAPGATVRVAVTVVAFTATKLLQVTPGPPMPDTPVAPPRSVPVRVTLTLVPRAPVL